MSRYSGYANSRVCFDFQKGKCTRGDRCRFSHEDAADEAAGKREPPVEDTEAEKRIDPKDGWSYTFEEVKQNYAHLSFSENDMLKFWDEDMQKIENKEADEKRIDPKDGKPYTFEEVKQNYAHMDFLDEDLMKFWNEDMQKQKDNKAGPEKRLDPKDWKSYTFEEVKQNYAHMNFSDQDILKFWEEDMHKVEEDQQNVQSFEEGMQFGWTSNEDWAADEWGGGQGIAADEWGGGEGVETELGKLPMGLKLKYAGRNLSDEELQAFLLEDDLWYEEVDFSCNRLSDDGLKKVMEICARCSKLRVLKLFKNNIGDVGAKELTKFLQKCRTIEELHLSHNHFTEKGVESIVKAGADNRPDDLNPLWLRLEFNDVKDPRKCLEYLTSRCSVCVRARDKTRCTVQKCKFGKKVHICNSFNRPIKDS